MKKIIALGFGLLVLSGAGFAQEESDAARQARMDEAYRHHNEGAVDRAEDGTRNGLHEAGHAVHRGVRATGHAVHSGVRATGHAIHRGVRATGHAIHHGVDAVTGH